MLWHGSCDAQPLARCRGPAVKDRRRVGDLSIEELERVLSVRRAAVRAERLRRYRDAGRALPGSPEVEIFEGEHQSSGWQWMRLGWMGNALLAIVELLAVAGLIYFGYQLWADRNLLNREAQQLMQAGAATLAPTPSITAVVLPGGHTPPNAAGGAQFNEAEIPEHLRPLVQAAQPISIPPTPGPRQAVRIQISAIGVDAAVVRGDSWEQLKKGVGQQLGTTDPGQGGNLVLSAHNDIFGEIFRYLDKLQPGDLVTLQTTVEKFTYRITGTEVVEPTDVRVLSSTTAPTLTLISCYPYLVDNKRIVVFAELQPES